jgi:hypothetical protein
MNPFRRILPLIVAVPGLALVPPSVFVSGCGGPVDAPPFEDVPPRAFVPIKFHKETLRVPASFSDSVTIEGDKILVPTTPANQATLAKVAVGKMVAGDQNRVYQGEFEGSPNPLGFIVKVVGIENQGDKVVLTTQPGRMRDLIKEGTLRFGADEPNIFDLDDDGNVIAGTPSALRAQSFGVPHSGQLRTLATGKKSENVSTSAREQSGSWQYSPADADKIKKDAEFKPILNFSNFECSYRLNASLEDSRIDYKTSTYTVPVYSGGEIPFQVGEEEVTSQSIEYAKLYMRVAPTLTCNMTLAITGTAKSKGIENKDKLSRTFTSPKLTVPLGGPIPMYVEINGILAAYAQVRNDLEWPVTVQSSGELAAGADWDGGKRFNRLGANRSEFRFSSKATETTFKTSVQAEAKLGVQVKLLLGLARAFGVGLKVEGGAKYSGGVKACISKNKTQISGQLGPSWYIQPEVIATSDFVGKKDFSLFRFLELKGDKEVKCDPPEKESCDSKANGFYCSANQSDYAYECRNKAYVTGLLCPNSGFATCTGGAGNRATINGKGSLVCN